jgi:hypothetical protein
MHVLRSILLAILSALGLVPRPAFVVQRVSDHPPPDAVQQGTIYVVGNGGYQKWVYLRNPADQDEIIQLSLMQNRRPCWRISEDFLGRPTLYPSVRQLEGSFAHFWIRKGGIVWCKDSGMPPFARDAQTARSSGLPPDLTA